MPITWAVPFFVVLMAPTLAQAFELSGGVSLGGFQAGTVPRLAVSPHAGISWRRANNFLIAVHDLCSILPPTNYAEIGVYNETSATIGYASETVDFSAGPSVSFYSMAACGLTLCGRVVGMSAGASAQTNVYFAGPLGVSVSANMTWIGGRSLVLPGSMALMFVAGPVLRWRTK